jgi:hypothetical protein
MLSRITAAGEIRAELPRKHVNLANFASFRGACGNHHVLHGIREGLAPKTWSLFLKWTTKS